MPGVADHPAVVGSVLLLSGSGTRRAVGYKPVDLAGSGDKEKAMYSDLMEVLCAETMDPAAGIVVMRECMAAVSDTCVVRAKLESTWDKLEEKMDAVSALAE